MLKPKNGVYDLRITAELWETHFFDMIKLVAVDHPEGTDLFIDERFAFPPPDLSFKITGEPQPVERILDENGDDMTDLIREIDQNYLHAFQKSKYQGVTEEHSIEIELGDEAPVSGPLWLLAHGWVLARAVINCQKEFAWTCPEKMESGLQSTRTLGSRQVKPKRL
jgi:hypothetical protein